MAWRILSSRAVVLVEGEKWPSFLQGLATQNTVQLAECNANKEHKVAGATAFLSVKGRILADTILFPRHNHRCLIDVDVDVASNLVRLLKRHCLREKLEIRETEDFKVTWCPSSSSSSMPIHLADPRFEGLGSRSIEEASSVLDAPLGDEEYLKHRISCGVLEGVKEFQVDKSLPLSTNLDLLNYINFEKGCYVGQELTTRSKRVGKVRKRLCSLIPISLASSAWNGDLREQICLTALNEDTGGDGGCLTHDNSVRIGTKFGFEGSKKSVAESIVTKNNFHLAVVSLPTIDPELGLNNFNGLEKAFKSLSSTPIIVHEQLSDGEKGAEFIVKPPPYFFPEK